ncbi:MAG: methyltransferase [Pseudomonadota bacterium]|nr:methyltransferase [Pseudomonadota bacterium]
MKRSAALALFAGCSLLAACSGSSDGTAQPPAAAAQRTAPTAAEALDAVLAGTHRPEEEKARDQYRHPRETLLFFGAEPSMTIVEVWPGGGWYSNVIAPFLASGGGVYYAAGLDPESSERNAKAVAAFEAKYKGDPDLYGTVTMTALSDERIAPDGTADLVLTFRNVHNWMGAGTAEENFRKFYAALKPGGVLGVVEHRAPENYPPEAEAKSGYVRESTVIALAERAGFELEARSEINANPADTKDHPFGVWTLPPVRRSSEIPGQPPADGFDRARYDAIGESDRMTLKFRKPLGADGALFE